MIVVNSYGRSGSTILWKSLGGKKGLWDLKQRPPDVYKTHDYPVPGLNMKMVYTFANPPDVVTSVIKMSQNKFWLKMHCQHLKVPLFDITKIYEADHLGLEKHLNAWLKVPGVAFIRYETMWNHQKELSDFLGMSVNLPPYHPRQSKGNRVGAYKRLTHQVQSLENFFIS